MIISCEKIRNFKRYEFSGRTVKNRTHTSGQLSPGDKDYFLINVSSGYYSSQVNILSSFWVIFSEGLQGLVCIRHQRR